MKIIVCCKIILGCLVAAALWAGVPPAFSQDATQSPSNQQNAPGTGGTSKPGTAGLPGGKSGRAAKSGNTSASTPGAAGRDESRVPGMAGSKSGSTATTPRKPQ
jgi:hypothetical protein